MCILCFLISWESIRQRATSYMLRLWWTEFSNFDIGFDSSCWRGLVVKFKFTIWKQANSIDLRSFVFFLLVSFIFSCLRKKGKKGKTKKILEIEIKIEMRWRREKESSGAIVERCGSRQQLTINTTIHTPSSSLYFSVIEIVFEALFLTVSFFKKSNTAFFRMLVFEIFMRLDLKNNTQIS